jgi:hypothetical protein
MREEAVHIGEQALNKMLTDPFDNAAFDSYSAKPKSGLRGVGKTYRVIGNRTQMGDSKQASVTVSWTYKNETIQHMVSGIKSK